MDLDETSLTWTRRMAVEDDLAWDDLRVVG